MWPWGVCTTGTVRSRHPSSCLLQGSLNVNSPNVLRWGTSWYCIPAGKSGLGRIFEYEHVHMSMVEKGSEK